MKTKILTITCSVALMFVFATGATAGKRDRAMKVASSLENTIIEPALKIEPWMTDNALWNVSSMLKSKILEDDVLTVEAWMLDNSNWGEYRFVTEEKLSVEPWMLDSNNWKTEVIKDEPLTVENWMTDSNNWR